MDEICVGVPMVKTAPIVAARLRRGRIVHELWIASTGTKSVVTSLNGEEIAERVLTDDEAGEWIDTVRSCGGVVNERGLDEVYQ